MVLSVCRGLLTDPNDAEDAFQATFLILVKKAEALRGPVALGGWLYLVARRVAIRANTAAARRRAYERRAGQMAKTTSEPEAPAGYDLLRALHVEIARLPKQCRLAADSSTGRGPADHRPDRRPRREAGRGRERPGAVRPRRGRRRSCSSIDDRAVIGIR